ncbi:hypothetical protein PSN45_004202 [Yamadazyma tenuis]|uniref:F-box domain-containing protein n=1 Tax=Candida tenuis (strain ATCC 10573 / BCRC 21748 / CBS 615 / JCM 9827 / NBRC 10315 / NRRL Y-1498 / VKM Y-70) TaxID=590646 RepID=G3B3T7_CANTC|nr:uncharacterized protein CANTEDRAFT_134312 [Yamadazyma tenuis ATCC 10573]EGV63729.1 hypothetical protein CANTEDRAFT_134312 [Yamadazyma tenuis ATCC 10573]WEJ96660.1 hypothetical protein PSN45_004202 [Yamadazyma tenuis]
MLTQLSPVILDRVLEYVDPTSLVNLACTNYQFYSPCLAKLYREIVVFSTCSLVPKTHRKLSFNDKTVICGLSQCHDTVKNLKMVEVRLSALNSALSINSDLPNLVKKVSVFDTFNQAVDNEIVQLLGKISANVYVENDKLRKYLKSKISFNSIIVDHVSDFKDIDELDIRTGHCEQKQLFFSKKRSYVIQNPSFFSYLKKNSLKIFPTSINIDRNTELSVIDMQHLKNLEVSLDPHTNLDFITKSIDLYRLQKLSIVQPDLYDHNRNEKTDLKLIEWLSLHANEFRSLSYLSISYNPPLTGQIVDEFEGNYLKKIEVLETLVNVINTLATPKINLVLPNYLEVLSCYEQPMNNLMWNGCKCGYCSVWLEKLDDFVNFHKYFDESSNYWKDLNNAITLNSLAQNYRCRYLARNNFDMCGSVRFQNWDFHTNHFAPIQFQCCSLQTVYESEYNDGREIYFDTSSTQAPCQYRQLFIHLDICMVHYLQGIVNKLVRLDRGNAESFEITDGDINDGDEPINLQNLYVSGFRFAFDKEMNGTNFYESYYD